jgi:hypothetical protein
MAGYNVIENGVLRHSGLIVAAVSRHQESDSV